MGGGGHKGRGLICTCINTCSKIMATMVQRTQPFQTVHTIYIIEIFPSDDHAQCLQLQLVRTHQLLQGKVPVLSEDFLLAVHMSIGRVERGRGRSDFLFSVMKLMTLWSLMSHNSFFRQKIYAFHIKNSSEKTLSASLACKTGCEVGTNKSNFNFKAKS